MGRMKTVAAIACSAMLLTSAAATAQTIADRTTFVTFSAPVSIPGATLPAGTYTFKLADSPANRNIVQVFDKDQMKLYATLLAVAADRTEAEGDPVITFRETAANRPPAVRFWYYAGERSGSEFVYPKSQAMEIARASGDSVMAVDTDSASIDEMKKGTPSRVTADAAQSATSTSTSTSTTSSTTAQPTTTAPARPEPATPAQPTTTPAQPTTTPAPAMVPAPAPSTADQTAGTSGRSEPAELPRTASELPVVALIGVLALAGALALRARRATV
jgi:cobalamin biosynthesis Mg chelatase CobN